MTRRSWEEGLSFFRRFREEHGDVTVPKDFQFSDSDFNLNVWITNTGARSDRLSAEQVNELDSLNFPWPKSRDENWDKRIEEFKRAVVENGNDTKIRHRFQLSTGEKVGIWCTRMRHYRSQAKLSRARIRELDDLGFDWIDSEKEEQVLLERRRRDELVRQERLHRFAARLSH